MAREIPHVPIASWIVIGGAMECLVQAYVNRTDEQTLLYFSGHAVLMAAFTLGNLLLYGRFPARDAAQKGAERDPDR